jgi:hypothetical protein
MRNTSNQRPIVLCDPDIKPIPGSASDADKLEDRPSIAHQSHDEQKLLAPEAPREVFATDEKVQD